MKPGRVGPAGTIEAPDHYRMDTAQLPGRVT